MNTLRRRFIIDMVEKYIKDYPDEYKEFLYELAQRKALLADKNYGVVKGEKAGELRVGLTMPRRIWDILSYVLKAPEKPFGEEKGEMKWFAKKFPQFLLPNSY